MNGFDDSTLRNAGLEYEAKLPCGKIVKYLAKETAKAYAEHRGALVIAPAQGPHRPVRADGTPIF